jgi:hypothetical protein
VTLTQEIREARPVGLAAVGAARRRPRTAELIAMQTAMGLVGHVAGEPKDTHYLGAPKYVAGIQLADEHDFAEWLTVLEEQGGEIVSTPHVAPDGSVTAAVSYLAWRVTLRYEPEQASPPSSGDVDDQAERVEPPAGGIAAGDAGGLGPVCGAGGPERSPVGDGVPGDGAGGEQQPVVWPVGGAGLAGGGGAAVAG